MTDDTRSALVELLGTAEPEHEWPEARRTMLAGYTGSTRNAVLDAIVPFLSKYEGVLTFMYLDTIGLVTCGLGNLVDPIKVALSLPWKRFDGSLATMDEVTFAWHVVKDRQDMRAGGGVAFGRLPGNEIRLDEHALAALVCTQLRTNEIILKQRCPRFDEWPAPAQLGLHSMAWAAGPYLRFPTFFSCVNSDPPDFANAAIASHMSNGAPARNAANRALFEQAAAVVRDGGNYDEIA